MNDQPSGTPSGTPAGGPSQTPASASTGAPAPGESAQPPAPLPPRRPAQPAFGEYAPEGWEWKPEGEAAADTAATASGAGGVPARPAGVPHNLGAPAQPQNPQAPSQTQPTSPQQPGGQDSAGAPYRAAAPQSPNRFDPNAVAQQATNQQQAAGQQQPAGQLPPAYRVPGAGGPRLGDRVITIILLVLGGFGALNIAGSFFGLESQIHLTATMIGLENTEVAGWVGPLGVISGLLVLLLFALTLIFSIQRMRANKLTFWVPLAAGGIAFVLLMVVPMIAMSAAPEIMTQIQSDPTGSLDKMLDYVSEMQTP